LLAGFAAGTLLGVAPTHLLAVVAIGLLGGKGGRRGFLLVPFAAGLLAGSVAIAFAIRQMPSAPALLAMAALSGIAVAAAIRLPASLTQGLALAAGATLALDAPPQVIGIPTAIASQIGTGVAAVIVLVLAASIAARADRPWQRVGLRVVGSWAAASAILVLALRLAR